MMTTKAFLIYLIVNILNTYIVSIFLKAFLGEHIKNKYIYRFHLLLYNPTQILIYIFIEKLVDCLEKCLICRHIRRFAD